MEGAAEHVGEYAIQVSAVLHGTGFGYAGRVVVQELPEMTVLLQEEVLACGRLWSRPRNALDAAFARGQQFVRMQLVRRALNGRDPGPHETPAGWDPGNGYSLSGWHFDHDGEVQSPRHTA